MKKLFSFIILILASFVVFSQTQKKEGDLLTELLGQNKKTLVSQFVDLPETHTFWKLYDEYEKQRELFGEKRYNLIVLYAQNYESHNDKKLEEIMDTSINLRNEGEKLLLTYYEQIKDECGIKTASQFYFVQRFVETTLNSNILGNLPIIEK